ncbi:unnamed protein product [Caenorhabditis auriculariae]|uniref:ATP-dependent RNA helicase n=1 Tax=Caenorhabditis auriculariae TaxID=2777116 RepID=A0A8S1HE23_9PELO|nr:unnamed protein product [Caenorhabditis auriculariae]
MTAFEEFGVIPQLGEAVSLLHWEFPTPIQSEAIPAILGGGDVLIAAETGSGKTGAFCLPVAQKFALNMADRDAGLSIGPDGLSCESRVAKSWFGSRCHAGLHTRGKYYYEVKIARDGLCRIGWSAPTASLNIGTDDKSFGFGGTGKKSNSRKFDDYGTSFTTNDVIGCYLDLDNLEMWWSKNGEEFPRAYNLPKVFADPSMALHPAVLVQNSSLKVNFGDSPFDFPPKKGFVGVSSASKECINWWKPGVASSEAADQRSPLCVILEPTRELVEQTHNNLITFAKKLENPPVRCVSVAAGVNMAKMVATLNEGADIVTGTPSRIVDLVQSRQLSLSALQFLVIDEADQFLMDKGGAAKLIDTLFNNLPLLASDGSRRQVIVCSATLHNMEIDRFADRYMSFPQWIDLKGMDSVAETVHHVVCYVDAFSDKQWIRIRHQPNHLEDDHIHDKDEIRCGTDEKNTLSLGTKILKGVYVLQAIKALEMDKAMIFCRTKQQCDQMEAYMKMNNVDAICLHGDRSPEERSKSLHAFKNDQVRFLICTDVAARGIDVHGVPFVINVTLPDEKSMYVHRIGRVGRAERMGLSISLVSSHEEKVWFHKCRSRGGVACSDTRDLAKGGCSIWYNEKKLLSEIEEHLGATIAEVDTDFRVPVDEFDGKIVYGSRRTEGATFAGHAPELATAVAQLADLETSMQLEYLRNVSSLHSGMKVL